MEDLDVGNDFAPDDWDDDDQGDADVQQPRRRKNYLTLWEKKDIVEEAYAAPQRVKATARKYGVQPKQIRRWRINANALTGLPHYPEPRTVEERGVIKKAKENVRQQHQVCRAAKGLVGFCYVQAVGQGGCATIHGREGCILDTRFLFRSCKGRERHRATTWWSRGGIHTIRIHSSATSAGQRSTQELQALLP